MINLISGQAFMSYHVISYHITVGGEDGGRDYYLDW